MIPMIASDTNPWIEVDGVPVDWTQAAHSPPVESRRTDNGCDSCGNFLDGVIESMDTDLGVVRCDECSIYEGDIEAAWALALLVGGVVRYEQEDEEETA